MSDVIVQLPLDRTGRNPNNLIGSEKHVLAATAGFPYKIITMDHGGFYVKSLRVYDANYNKLVPDQDYIVTYVYKNTSESTGLDICGAIVFLDKARTGTVYCSAQMVGGDLCFSFTVVEDYVAFYKTKATGYIPKWMDYVGNEPIWKPGELEKERWHLDTYQPFNNEIEKLSVTVEGGDGVEEDNYRKKVDQDYLDFLAKFNDRLDRHIADLANPHQDVKSTALIGLNLVQNYPVATQAGMETGTANDHYVTPALTKPAIDKFAIIPLNNHIGNKANPHKVTALQTGAADKAYINTAVNKKYLKNERVANATLGNWNGVERDYAFLYDNFRGGMTVENFPIGRVNPARFGHEGVPSANSILIDGSWQDWDGVVAGNVTEGSPTIKILTIAATLTPQQAFNIAVSDPDTYNMAVGSMIFYKLNYTVEWGVGNGASVYTWTNIYGAYKSATGWANMVQ